MIMLEACDLVKRYTAGDGGTITVLDGVNLQVSRGEMVAVVGASGTGKSTLLQLLGALDEPTRGARRRVAGRHAGRRADRMTSCLHCAIGRSGSCFSSITSFASSQRWKT